MQPLICQLEMLPDFNFFFAPSSSIDGSDLLLQLELVLYFYNLPEKHFILSRLLDFRVFYLCTQSPEEGGVNRICFILAFCECLSVRNRIVPVPDQ